MPTVPLQAAPALAPPPGAAPSSNDLCPICHARMAPDQRYCLSCGSRRGEPRLPFMDAVKFMEASHQPPVAAAAAAAPPQPPRQRFAAGTTLVAGIATLVLAIGVGVLIGQSGDNSAQPVAQQPPIVVKTDGGGGEEASESTSSAKSGKAKGANKKKGKEESIETGSSGTSKEAEEFIKPDADVKLAPPTTGVGDDCEKGTAGCGKNNKFDGTFFGE